MSDPFSTLIFRAAGKLRRRELRRFQQRLQKLVAGGRPFTCLITGDRELRRLNREFLARDEPADVLAFPAGPLPDEAGSTGDVAISLARARDQARAYGHPVEDEIRVLMLHGLLHLLGMDHQADGGRMARAEARWRRKLGLPAGLIQRGRS